MAAFIYHYSAINSHTHTLMVHYYRHNNIINGSLIGVEKEILVLQCNLVQKPHGTDLGSLDRRSQGSKHQTSD